MKSTTLSKKLKVVLSEKKINKPGKSIGFSQRLRQIPPFQLIVSMITAMGDKETRHFSEIHRYFNQLTNKNVRYKPFHNQLAKPEFAQLMRDVADKVFNRRVNTKLKCNHPVLASFDKLLIRDGSSFAIHKVLSKTIKPGSLKKVTVDTTVQEKNIAFPTDSKLLNKARENLVKLSKEHGIKLRQNYNRVGPQYVLMVSRYAHAKQFKRMKKMNNKLKSRLGRVKRDIERQLPNYSVDIQSLFEVALKQAQKLIEQEQHSKHKLYSLHAPEVECISKGKAHKPYEFGVKTSIAVTNKEGFVIGAQSCPGNPYDGHTLLPQLEQIKQFTVVQPEHCFVDRGYRGHEVKDTKVFISGQKRGVTRSIKKALKRRSAIEPEIGHMKNDGRLDRCYLKGAVGDAINVVMVAAGHNLRKILNKLRLLWLKIISGLMGYFIKPEQSAALNLA